MDRNTLRHAEEVTCLESLSVRRAWIEIFVPFEVIRPAIGRSP